MAELKTRIILRNDTAANWTLHNPVLKSGEMGIETDTNMFKFGDGVKAWNELAYAGKGEAELKIKSSQVIMDKNFVFTAPMGTVTQAKIDRGNGSYTYEVAENTTFDTWFAKLSAEAKNPTVVEPKASVTLNQAGAKEVGTKVIPTYTASLTAGSYTYGPTTGISATSYSVIDGVTGHEAQTGATGTFPELQIVDNTNYKLTATIAHGAGTNPKNNLGEEVAALAIKAGNKTNTSSAITGYRSVFAGASVAPIAIDSASIRGLKGKTGAYTASFNLAIPEGCTQVVIALPNGHTVKKVEDVGAFGTDIFSVFVKQTAQVEGANNYTAAAYNVYVYTPASALGANTYKVTCA